MSLRIAVATVAFVALGSGANAAWGPNDDSHCLESCQKNPGVSSSLKSKCPAYCACVSGEVGKLFSAAEQDQIVKDIATKTDSLNLKRFKVIFPGCARRTMQ